MNFTTVFIDRDGTIGGSGHYCAIEEFVLYEKVREAIQLLKKSGCQVFALTNQTKIAEGKMNRTALEQSLKTIGFDEVFICPHQENSWCTCRKPKTGLLEEAENLYQFDRTKAVVIGDSYRADMNCANDFGVLGIHVATGRGAEHKDSFTGNCLEKRKRMSTMQLNGSLLKICKRRSNK
ncbi:hypothetical protein IGI37_001695 [Enterococcus sp. AZ194]|uniref:HAD-IIIA family hydrolase n=1 Tax=Enterococcus sp. AZ194 TaxID=2774629 RepID=UPI003F1ED583